MLYSIAHDISAFLSSLRAFDPESHDISAFLSSLRAFDLNRTISRHFSLVFVRFDLNRTISRHFSLVFVRLTLNRTISRHSPQSSCVFHLFQTKYNYNFKKAVTYHVDMSLPHFLLFRMKYIFQ